MEHFDPTTATSETPAIDGSSALGLPNSDPFLNQSRSPEALHSGIERTELTPLAVTQMSALETNRSPVLAALDTSDVADDPFAIAPASQTPLEPLPQVNSGVFSVGESGHICIDYLHDGGGWEGELAIFSLDGMEALEPGSTAYIQEAARRALSDSKLGHIAISDKTEGARFDRVIGAHEKKNWNAGEHKGLKHFNLAPNSEFAFIFAPKGSIKNVLNNPNRSNPLFSLEAPNASNAKSFGRFASLGDDGKTFAFGDRFGDSDYNDLIFRVLGADGTATAAGDLLAPDLDWTGTAAAQDLFGNIAPESLHFSTDTFYSLGETVTLLDNGVSDANGSEDIARVDFWLQVNNGNWVDIADVTQFDTSHGCEAQFEYALNNLAAGRYNLRGTAYDSEGAASGEFTRSFTVLPISNLSSRVKYAIERATNLERYTDAQLDTAQRWVVNTQSSTAAQTLANATGATNLGFTGHLPNTFVLEFGDNANPVSQLENSSEAFFFYPLIPVNPQPQTTPSTLVPGSTANNPAQGTTIGVIDDGLDPTALPGNSRSAYSRDFKDGDADPTPLPGQTHGTTIAEQINQIAPGADLAGLRLTGDTVADPQIADALGHRNQDIDIYNNSWGNTNWFDLPQMEFQLEVGAESGRDGFGNVFVFAGGDRAQAAGNMNYNPFANSRHTIAVGALDGNGQQLPLSEPGASLVVSVPAETTDSAAAIVSGVTAQMLAANPTLNWRDIQHILVETANRNDSSDAGWQQNQAGYWTNQKYGFGQINADAAVAMAQDWTTVEPEVAIEGKRDFSFRGGEAIPDGGSIRTTLEMEEDITVESLELMIDGLHDFSGDLRLVLTSPDGTRSVLAQPYTDGAPLNPDWTYTSLRHWGESSRGDWTLEVFDADDNNLTGSLTSWKLNLFGTRPTVTVDATDTYAKEGGNPGQFTVTRTGNPKHALEVTYEVEAIAVSGQPTARPGEDYETLSGTVIIPAGATSATVTVNPIEDNLSEWRERVDIKITDTKAYEVGAENRDTLLIWDNDTPQVYLFTESWPYRGNKGYASESGNVSGLTVRRIGELETDLTVNYSLSGTATNGQDYSIPAESVTFAAVSPNDPFRITGQHHLSLGISPIDDTLVEGDENLIITLNDDAAYTVLERLRSKEVEIADNDDRPTVSLEVSDRIASEDGDLGYYTITRDGDTTAPLTVNYFTYDISGYSRSAYNSDPTSVFDRNPNNTDPFVQKQLWDYTLPGSVTIPTGQNSARIYVNPINDSRVEPTESLYLWLKPDAGYSIAPHGSDGGTVSILDNDEPTVEWQEQASLSTLGRDRAQAVTVDGAGNTYLVGRTDGEIDGANAGLADSFIAKYDRNGNQVWQQSLVATAGFDETSGIAVVVL